MISISDKRYCVVIVVSEISDVKCVNMRRAAVFITDFNIKNVR